MRQGICNGSEARLSIGPLQRSVWIHIVSAFDVPDLALPEAVPD